jgi:tetratricopeptide (TPR) repeat protein
MKKTLIFAIFASFLAACGGAAPVVSNQASESSQNSESGQGMETVTAHSVDRGEKAPEGSAEKAPGSEEGKSGWSRGGTPIDTTSFDAEIKSAEAKVKSSPASESAKKELSQAYYKRAVALTEARQYASALGDYRRAVKYDASNVDAKDWIEKIVVIYDGMNKSYPKEGEEPAALEFKAGKV